MPRRSLNFRIVCRRSAAPSLLTFHPQARPPPDLPDAAAGRPRRGSHEKGTREEGEQPAAGPGNAKPQEPTD